MALLVIGVVTRLLLLIMSIDPFQHADRVNAAISAIQTKRYISQQI